jgi:hypothetical protein
VAAQGNSTLSDLDWQAYLHDETGKLSQYGKDEVIVVRVGSLDRLYWLNPGSGASRIESHICTGAVVPSCFLPEHFTKRVPVRALKALALLTLDYARREGSTVVGEEYDLLCLTSAGFALEEYSSTHETVASLRSKFERSIAESLYPSNS